MPVSPDVAHLVNTMLAKAFDWPEEDRDKVRPDDSVWGFYWHFYPREGWLAGWPDELEMETLARDLNKACGSDNAADLLKDHAITVRDLALFIQRRAVQQRVAADKAHPGGPASAGRH